MKQLFMEAEGLWKEAEELKNELQDNRKSLATLAAAAGNLAYRFAGLRTEIIKRHERNQLNEFNTNS